MIAIIAILVALLIPAVQRVRANARATQRKNNLSELSTAMKHFEGTGRGNLKEANWEQTLLPYADQGSEVFIDPADEDGSPSYALSNKVVKMGSGDDTKIAIIESDDRIINLNTESCSGSAPDINGKPATRHFGTTNALLYGGSVQTFEPIVISLTDTTNEPLVLHWLPHREHGLVCGTVVVVDNPNSLPMPTGSEPDAALTPTTTPEPTAEPSASETPEGPEDSSCLVAHWEFDDPLDPGSDSSPSGLHYGTLSGDAHLENDADHGSVLALDGAGDWIDVPHHADIMVSDMWTITLWLNVTEDGEANNEFIAKRDNNNTTGIIFGIWFEPWIAHYWANTHGNPAANHSGWERVSANFGPHVWRHAAVTYDSSQMQVFINGSLISTTTLARPGPVLPNTKDLRIGANSMATYLRETHGWIDDVRIYNCVLDPISISALAQ